MTECTHTHQEERRHDETPAHTINVKSFVTSAGESQVVDITPVWHLSITESRLVKLKSINPNMMLLQQFLPAIRSISTSQASSLYFSRTVPRCTGRLNQTTVFS